MWIYSTLGTWSVVCGREGDGAPGRPLDPDRLMVRARVRQHLENLRQRFPDLPSILETPHNDYYFRIVMPKARWKEVLVDLVSDQTYSNFKRATEEQGDTSRAYLDCLHRTWAEAARLQQTEEADRRERP